MRRAFFSLLLLISFCATLSSAAFGDAFDTVGAREYVDPELLRAIAKQESGMHQYALNCAGKAYYPANIQEAMKILRGYDQLICDVGIMQINYSWNALHRKISVVELFDVEKNITVAAQILKENMSGTKNSWKAVGRYHTWKHTSNAKRYAWKVYRHYVALKEGS